MSRDRELMNVRLEVEIEDEAISGEVSSNGGPAHRFSGYAGLIAALESIRAEHADASEPDVTAAGSAAGVGR